MVGVEDARVWEVVVVGGEAVVDRSLAICRRRAMRARVKKRAFRRERMVEIRCRRFRQEKGDAGEERPWLEGRQSPSRY